MTPEISMGCAHLRDLVRRGGRGRAAFSVATIKRQGFSG